jgi:peptidoglycan/LPS O-acetylase OafA/YrhL
MKIEKRSIYRRDIVGLRAFAVISVVAGHYFPSALKNGFLGVDVFFVISGYVITQLLINSNESNWFNFLVNFYAKRISRLLPALLVTVYITYTLTLLIVARVDVVTSNSALYGIMGISNVYLLHISQDYFGPRASQNPFTHTWSLGVEGQFYFIFPLVVILARKISSRSSRALILGVLLIASITSMVSTILLSASHGNLVFYTMPTRFWELGYGAIAYLLLGKRKLSKLGRIQIRSLAFCIILVTLFVPFGSTYAKQLLITSATVLILMNESSDIVSRILSHELFRWLGDRSYSIYLIHWPLLVLSNYLLGVSFFKNLICIPFILILSAFMHNVIENPFRTGRFKTTSIKTIAIGLPVVLVSCLTLHFAGPIMSNSNNFLLSKIFRISPIPAWIPTPCSGAINIAKIEEPFSSCLGGSLKSSKSYVYLIGDSHADQLVSMVRRTFISSSYEVKNLNMENGIDFPFGELLPNANSASLNYLKKNSKRGDIVILAFHRGHLNALRDAHIDLKTAINLNNATQNLIQNLDDFSAQMLQIGVKIILVRDTPLMRNIETSQSCVLQRKLLNWNSCRVTELQDLHTRYLQDYAFNKIESKNKNVISWDPFDYIYGKSNTFDVVLEDGSYSMWDWHHITQQFGMKLYPSFAESTKLFINLEE